MKIYLASSWRNSYQSLILSTLRDAGYTVYDFKNPAEGNNGFSWKQIDSGAENWSTEDYIRILNHPIAEAGFKCDWDAMKEADCCVLLLPCGRSAHIEAGYFVGAHKPVFIYIPDDTTEPELMYKMANGVYHVFSDLMAGLDRVARGHQCKEGCPVPNSELELIDYL